MKKIISAMLSLLLAFSAVFAAAPIAFSQTTGETITYNEVDFTYDVEEKYNVNSNGELWKYNGEIKNLAVPEYVNGIRVVGVAPYAFNNDSSLNAIYFPNSVKYFSLSSFRNASELKLVVAKGCRSLSPWCFSRATKLEALDSDDIVSIGLNCFEYCSSITAEGLKIKKLLAVPACAFQYCSSLNKLEFDEAIGIGESAFTECDSLTSVNLPNAKTIDRSAFYRCDNIKSVTLNSVEQIASEAFAYCKALDSVSLPKVKHIGKAAFDQCSITDFSAPNVETVLDEALRGNPFTSVSFPKIKTLGASVFGACKNLSTVEMPELDSVPASLFSSCKALSEIPSAFKNAEEIGDSAFYSSGITEINLPNTKIVGKNAFGKCSITSDIYLPKVTVFKTQNLNLQNVTTLDLPNAEIVGGFMNSNYLESANLPNCYEISEDGFSNCKNLQIIYAPKLTTIRANAFSKSRQLQPFSLANVHSIEEGALDGCYKFDVIYVPKLNKANGGINGDGITNIYAPKLISVWETMNNIENCKNVYLPSAKGWYTYPKRWNSIKDVTFPSLTHLEYKRGESTSGNNYSFIFHAPNLTDFDLGGTQINCALPQSIDHMRFDSTPSLPFTIYTNNETLLEKEEPYVTFKKPIELKTDLQTEFTTTQESPAIYVQAYTASPVYTWYYSENGESYTKLGVKGRYFLVPDKSGYYYCTVSDDEGSPQVTSAICKVTVGTEIVTIDNQIDEEYLCVLCGDWLYDGVEQNEKLTVPKGAQINVLTGSARGSILVNEDEIGLSYAGFVFNASNNASLRYPNRKVITESCISVNDAVFNPLADATIPEYSVTYNGESLTENEDYTIEFYSNHCGGTAIYSVTGINNYEGNVVGEFTITPFNIKKCDLAPVEDYEYTGAAPIPQINVTYNGVNLNKYCKTYELNGSRVANYDTGATGDGVTLTSDYISTPFTIYATPRLLNIFLDETSFVYNGKAFEPKVIGVFCGTPTGEAMYLSSCAQYEDNVEPGTGKAIVALNDYSCTPRFRGVATLEFEIKEHPHDFVLVSETPAGCTKDGEKAYKCSCGKEQTQAVPATGHDYKMSTVAPTYFDSGYAVYTCSHCGDTYTVVRSPALKLAAPKKAKSKRGKKQFTASWQKSANADGYEIQYSLYKNFKKSTLKSSTRNKITVKKLKAKKKYYIRVRAYKKSGNRIVYSDWSNVVKVKMK